MPHEHSPLLLLGGAFSGLAGGLLIVYSPNWRHHGSHEKATLFLLVGFILGFAGALMLAMDVLSD